MIRFFSEEVKFVFNNKRLVSNWLKSIAKNNGYLISNLNIIFCSDEYLLNINKQYLGHNYYTDIITFDNSFSEDIITKTKIINGDIFISIDTVKCNGQEYGEGFDNELYRVIVHGLLHLIGFNDINDNLQQQMTEQENISLKILNEMKLMP
jgi:rRNA maturation RNase YbeY